MDVVAVCNVHYEPFSFDPELLQYFIAVSEFAEHGSLHDYLHELKFQVDYKQRLKWAMQIAKGMYICIK